MRLPVLPIPQFEILFKNIINDFHNNQQQKYGASKLDEYLYKLAEGTVDYLIEKLRKISPADEGISLKSLCERLLVLQAYKIVNRHLYDEQGGDVDIHCQRLHGNDFIFESGIFGLYVQVKKHENETDERSVQQVLDMIANQNADKGYGCVMSSADDISPEAKRLAESNGIVLLSKREICSLLLPLLATFLD